MRYQYKVFPIKTKYLDGMPEYIWRKRRRLSKVQKQGLSFENRVQKFLQKEQLNSNWLFLKNRWFAYKTEGKHHWQYAEMDGIIIVPEELRVLIVEVKLKHSNLAYRQMNNLYRPILQHLQPVWRVDMLEVVRYCDRFDLAVEPYGTVQEVVESDLSYSLLELEP